MIHRANTESLNIDQAISLSKHFTFRGVKSRVAPATGKFIGKHDVYIDYSDYAEAIDILSEWRYLQTQKEEQLV